MSQEPKDPFASARQQAKFAKTSAYQDRVNQELLRAIERLGDRLSRTEEERDRLSYKLSELESHAVRDNDTGRLYLPVRVMEPAYAQQQRRLRSVSLLAVASVFAAFFSISAVIYQNKVHSDQIAALEKMPQFAQLRPAGSAWKPLMSENEEPRAYSNLSQPSPVATEESGTEDMVATEPAPPAEEITATEPAAGEAEEQQPAAQKEPEAVEAAKPVIAQPQPKAREEQEETSFSEKVSRVAPQTEDLPARDPDLPAQFSAIENLARKGNAESQHDLATIYASGRDGVKVDYGRAALWFEKAAQGGIANADYNLGVMYHQGMGVKPDLAKAISWYRKAADQDHPEALYNLAIAYFDGVGTEKNPEMAIALFKKAAALGIAQAAYNLGAIYESDTTGKTDKKQALFWYMHAAKQNHPQAREAIARLTGVDPFTDRSMLEARAKELSQIEPTAGETDFPSEAPASVADEKIKNVINAQDPNQEMVRNIQRVLIAMKLLPEPATGVYDVRTQDAIRTYQQKYSLYVDGVASVELLHHMVYDRGKAMN